MKPLTDMVCYEQAHRRVRKVRGTPSQCEHCSMDGPRGPRGYHWALVHGTAAVVRDSKGRTYSLNPQDYIRLCGPCHMDYDGTSVARLTGRAL